MARRAAELIGEGLLDLHALGGEDLADGVLGEVAVEHAVDDGLDEVPAHVLGQLAARCGDAGRVERVADGDVDAEGQALDGLEGSAALGLGAAVGRKTCSLKL